jgi:hypothetical protein
MELTGTFHDAVLTELRNNWMRGYGNWVKDDGSPCCIVGAIRRVGKRLHPNRPTRLIEEAAVKLYAPAVFETAGFQGCMCGFCREKYDMTLHADCANYLMGTNDHLDHPEPLIQAVEKVRASC